MEFLKNTTLDNPEILHQMRENAHNKELQYEIAKTNNAEYIAKIIGQKIIEFQSTFRTVCEHKRLSERNFSPTMRTNEI